MLCSQENSKLRSACIEDVNITFKWAMDPLIRQFSFNSCIPDYNEHLLWFTKKIQSKSCLYFILENATNKIGSIRFDFDETNNATLSYLIDPAFHGRGYGTLILSMALTRIKELGDNSINIIGFVKDENFTSVKIFEKLAFKLKESKNNVLKFEKNLASWI